MKIRNGPAKIAAMASLAVLAGCVAPPPITPEQAKAMEPPTCNSQGQCAVMWQRAQIWLVNNSAWRIQMANDTLLQTFGPGDSTDVAYTVTRSPIGGGGYQIVMRAACGNIFGCIPKPPRERIIEFNNYLRQTPIAYEGRQ